MKIAYFDCFAGIAGDMVLGAFLDCGVPLEELKQGLASLPVQDWDIEATPVLKSGIHGLKVRVSHGGHSDDEEFAARKVAEGSKIAPVVFDAHHDHAHEFGHHHGDEPHGHAHDGQGHQEPVHHGFDQHHDLDLHCDPAVVHGEHAAGHTHSDAGSHDGEHHHHGHGDDHHTHGDHTHGRSMAEIRGLIEASALSPRVRATALDIFGRIAVVEAELHHSTPDQIHFHEIGGVDSLIDICGAAWCLEYLNVERVYCSALPYSTGTVECAHGTMPVPAPATLKLLRGAPMVPSGLTGEMITPTGAGILAALAHGFGDPPAFTPRLVGFGAGTKNWPGRPNLLRITIGETIDESPTVSNPLTPAADGLEWRTLSLLETNIDDMNPELWSHVLDRLFQAGALDAWLAPAQMKKNRPAQTLAALCAEDRRDAVLRVVLRETTSLGVRVSTVQRAALSREMAVAETPWGKVRLKVARWHEGGVFRAAPEWEDVARLARESGVPAGEIYAGAARAWQNEGERQKVKGTNTVSPPSSPLVSAGEAGSFPDLPHQELLHQTAPAATMRPEEQSAGAQQQ